MRQPARNPKRRIPPKLANTHDRNMINNLLIMFILVSTVMLVLVSKCPPGHLEKIFSL